MRLRLRAQSLDFWVDVRVRCFGERWIAVADIADEQELGVGLAAQEALAGHVPSSGVTSAAATHPHDDT